MYKVAKALEWWGDYSGLRLPTSGVGQLNFIQECVSKRRSADAELWDILSREVWSHSHKAQTRKVQPVQKIEWLH